MPQDSEHLTHEEVREVYHLLVKIRDAWSDRAAWQHRLLDGMRKMLGLEIAVLQLVARPETSRARPVIVPLESVGWKDEESRRLYVESCDPSSQVDMPGFVASVPEEHRTDCVAFSRRMIVDDDTWYASRFFQEYVDPTNMDEFVVAMKPTPMLGSTVMLGGNRHKGAQPIPLGAVRKLAILAEEMIPMMGTELALAHQISVDGLTRRQRECLKLLLDGLSEKQVALEMGIKQPTVHDYVVALHRHFEVSSRSELLSYFIRRRPRTRTR